MRTLFLFLLALLLLACEKEKSNDAQSQSATLIIRPDVLGCSNENVRVRLYESESDYQTLSNHIDEKYSDSEGKVEFNELEEKIYYFQCYKSCSAGGSGMTANNFCDPSIEVYATNGSLSDDHPQDIEVQLCY